MTDRERLFELVAKVQDGGFDLTDVVAMRYTTNELLIDYLLANGVTFAKDDTDTNVGKWIPLTETTPMEAKDVLLRIKSKTTGMTAVTVGYCYTYYWCHQPVGLRWFEKWRASYEPAGGNLDESWDVTHWMPLPKEPREEAE